MAQSFLDKLTSRLAGRHAKAIDSFEGLVKSVADDRPPQAEQAEAVLAAAGKTPADLAAAVARIHERRDATAAVARAADAAKQLDMIRAEAVACDTRHGAALAELQRSYALESADLARRSAVLERVVEAGRLAEGLLAEQAEADAPADVVASLRQQLDSARARRDRLLHQANKAGWRAQEAATTLTECDRSKPTVAGHGLRVNRPHYEAALKSAEADEAAARKAAEEPAAEVAKLEAELAKLGVDPARGRPISTRPQDRLGELLHATN